MKKLYLLSGPCKKSGYTTVDIRPGADIQASIPPLPDEIKVVKWDVIELIHGLEHFTLKTGRELLKEIRVVLAPGGLLVLELPNFDYCVRSYIAGKGLSHGMWGIYGDQNFGTIEMAHKYGYTPTSLTAELKTAGFTRIKVKPAQTHIAARDFRVEAQC